MKLTGQLEKRHRGILIRLVKLQMKSLKHPADIDRMKNILSELNNFKEGERLLEALKDTTKQLGLYLQSIEDGKDDDAESAYQHGFAIVAAFGRGKP